MDTPPSAGGIEFFTAPAEFSDLIGGRLFRWITGGSIPGRNQLYNMAARPALRIVDVALGSDLLERVTAFLFDLRSTYDGLRKRSKDIERHFRRSSTLVVTTADPAPVAEATRFFQALPMLPVRRQQSFSTACFRPTGKLRTFRRTPLGPWPRTSRYGLAKPTARSSSVMSSLPGTERRSPKLLGKLLLRLMWLPWLSSSPTFQAFRPRRWASPNAR